MFMCVIVFDVVGVVVDFDGMCVFDVVCVGEGYVVLFGMGDGDIGVCVSGLFG